MKSFFTLAAFAAGTNALIGRSDGCCFHLTASGGASGSLGQLNDGQNRIGDNSLSPAKYCVDSNGTITDSSGRGCILTAPTTQFQCDTGATPTPGFSISPSGKLEYQGSPDFIACETGQNHGMNIYTTNSSALTQCKSVQLTADSCSGSGAGSSASSSAVASSTPVSSAAASSTPAVSCSSMPSAPASSAPLSGSPITVMTTVTVTECSCPASSAPGSSGSSAPSAPSQSASFTSVPASSGGASPSGPAGQPSSMTSVPASSASATPSGTSSASGSCGTTLSSTVGGNYEFPHLIVPVNSASPDTAYGTQYNGTVTSSISSIFNFDIPSSDSGKTCSLVFLFPQKADLETSSYSFSGDGKIDIAQLSGVASSSTTYNNAPSVSKDLGDITITPGNGYVISTFSCPAGQTVAYEMKNAGSTDLNFFEDYNPSPLGLYITVC